MIMSSIIIALGAMMTLFWLRPPRALRYVAWANLILYTLCAIAFSQMTAAATRGVDALTFFNRGGDQDYVIDSFFQADFAYFVSNRLQQLLPLDYMSLNLFSAVFFSYTGLLLIMRANPLPTKTQKLVWWIVTLLPSFHFWTAPYGKDSMQLLFVGLFFAATGTVWRVGALGGVLLLRPHVALVLGLAEFIANVFQKRLSRQQIFWAVLGLTAFGYAVDYLVERLGGQLSISSILQLFSEYGDDWSSGMVRNNDLSTPLGLIEFLFRPYIWEARNWSIALSSFDALLAGGLIVFVLLKTPIARKLQAPWLSAVLLLVMLTFTNPNVGTALRKKQLIVFTVLIVAVSNSRRRYPAESAYPIGRDVRTSGPAAWPSRRITADERTD